MGIEGSKPLERKPSRTKSNLAEKTISNEDICEFTSQLNSLASLGSTTTDKLDYIVFQKLPFSGKFTPLPFCSYLSTNYNSGISLLIQFSYVMTSGRRRRPRRRPAVGSEKKYGRAVGRPSKARPRRRPAA